MSKTRLRIVESEPCGRCGAKRKRPCRNYKGQRKVTCFVAVGCPRCQAQIGRCKHAGRVLIQRDLFPDGSAAWTPRDVLPAVGTTGDDNRRSVK